MLKRVYGDAAVKPRPDAPWEPWIDVDRIDGEIQALLEHDPSQAERWFLNRKLAGESVAFDVELYKLLTDPQPVPDRAAIAIGVDGARFRDALSIECTVVETGYQWTAGLWERPKMAEASYEHPKQEVDDVMLELFRRFQPWRAYVDPQYIDHLMDLWQGRWGDRVQPWLTNRDKPIAYAVRNFTTAIGAADLRHDGHRDATRHVANARKKPVNVFDEKGRQLHTISKDRPDSPRKMDAAMAKVLSWECRGDAIADGALKPRRSRVLVAH